MTETHTLSHTTWNCKYHIVFAPKYRRKVFYGEKRQEIGAILRQLCKWKAGGDTAKVQCFTIHGISERKEQPDDI